MSELSGVVHEAQEQDGAVVSTRSSDLPQAMRTVIALAAIGAILGIVWAAWSPPGPQAQVLGHGEFIVDETEAFVAADGRFLVLAVIVGLVAAVLAWTDRAHRGPAVVGGLVLGGIAGSLLMELVGHLFGGGSFHGTQFPGTDVYLTARMPLSLHMQGLLLVESVVASLVYGVLVAFAAADDLGRPDPYRSSSVDPGDHPQDGWRNGDAAGALQQGDLAPQQPRESDEPLR